MKPKNNKERQIAFIKFLAIFLVSNLTIVFAIYFNYKIPNKENEVLKSQAELTRNQTNFQRYFFNEMVGIKSMLDSLNIPGQNVSYQNSLISARLVELKKKVPTKDSTYRYDMYTKIINLFVELQDIQREIRALDNAKVTIEEYKEALDRCSANLKQAERDLFIARGTN